MTRKRTSENDLVVSAGAAAAPTRRKSAGSARAKRSAVPPETPSADAAQPQSAAPPAAPSANEIAHLAYLYWESRGCQGGSPEEDWLRAEQELHARALTATA